MTIQQHASFDSSAAELNATSKLVKAWESKNAKNAAKAGGISMMALSLAACGGSDATTTTATTTTTTTTTTTATTANAAVTLTAGPDTLVGDSNNDTFNALTDGFLEAGDNITGGASTNDKLVIRDYDSSAGTFTMSGVEVIDINFATTGQTLDLEDVTGATSLIIDSGVANNTVANVAASTTLTLANISAGVTNIDITFADGAFDPAANSYSVTLDDVDDALALSLDSFGTNVEAIDTLNVSTGANDNDGAITFDVEGANAETVVVTGSGNASLSGLTSGTVNAAAATGNLTLTMGTEETSITGGAGDDDFVMGATLTYEDTIVGGDGTDTLTLSTAAGTILSSAATGNVANVSGIETLALSAQLTDAMAIDMSALAGLTTIEISDFGDAGSTSDHVTITKAPDGLTISVGDAVADTLVADLSVDFVANSAVNDLTLKMDAVTIPDLVNTDGYADALTIESTGTNAISLNGYAANSLVVTGTGSLDLSSAALNATTATVDASGLSAAFTVTASATGTEITGGSDVDTVIGGAGADIISTGAGNDIIDGAAGNDTITLGAGDDEVIYDGTTDGTDKITDFVVADDFFDINSLVTDGGVYAALAETKVQFVAVDADVTLAGGIVVIDNGDNDIADADSLTIANIIDRMNDLGDDNNAGAADNIFSLAHGDDDFVFAISDGTDTALVHMTGDGTNTDMATSDIVILATIEGMSDAGTLTAANFDGFS